MKLKDRLNALLNPLMKSQVEFDRFHYLHETPVHYIERKFQLNMVVWPINWTWRMIERTIDAKYQIVSLGGGILVLFLWTLIPNTPGWIPAVAAMVLWILGIPSHFVLRETHEDTPYENAKIAQAVLFGPIIGSILYLLLSSVL